MLPENKLKGCIGEIAVVKDLLQQGLPVFQEVGDLSRVDVITVVNNKPLTIQVKTTKSTNEIAQLWVRKANPNPKLNYTYSTKDIDLFALYVMDKDMVLYINSKEALKNNKNSLHFRFKSTKNNQSTNVRYAKDYTSLGAALR